MISEVVTVEYSKVINTAIDLVTEDGRLENMKREWRETTEVLMRKPLTIVFLWKRLYTLLFVVPIYIIAIN